MPGSVGAASRTSDMRRPRRPQPWQRSHDRESGRADRLGRVACRRRRPRPGAAPQRRRSRRRRARHRRASVGRMGSRRLLGRRVRSQAACRSSTGLSSGSESSDRTGGRIFGAIVDLSACRPGAHNCLICAWECSRVARSRDTREPARCSADVPREGPPKRAHVLACVDGDDRDCRLSDFSGWRGASPCSLASSTRSAVADPPIAGL